MAYLKARLREASTWAGFGAAVAGAAVVPPPYSWVVIGCGVMAVLMRGGAGDGQ